MTLTAARLVRCAGLPAMVAGILFVIIQPLHPPDDLASVTTGIWAIVHYLTLAMSVLGLLGITGLYARQVEEAGWLGLAGFLLLGLWLLLTTAFVFVEAFLLPPLALTAPAFVHGFLGIVGGHVSEVELGVLPALWPISGLFFLLGGVLFAVATLRAAILPRWAAGLFGFGGLLSAPLVVVLPQFERLAAVPVGLGLAWLGYALWTGRRESYSRSPGDSAR